jgi:hypothetical protein
VSDDRHPLFKPLIFVGGLIFGFGLGFSHMARPEVVLNFLQFEDLGLPFVMFGAAIVSGIAFALLPRIRDVAPLTGDSYDRRLKAFDRNVLVGGAVFGVGWGISGICPGRGVRQPRHRERHHPLGARRHVRRRVRPGILAKPHRGARRRPHERGLTHTPTAPNRTRTTTTDCIRPLARPRPTAPDHTRTTTTDFARLNALDATHTSQLH